MKHISIYSTHSTAISFEDRERIMLPKPRFHRRKQHELALGKLYSCCLCERTYASISSQKLHMWKKHGVDTRSRRPKHTHNDTHIISSKVKNKSSKVPVSPSGTHAELARIIDACRTLAREPHLGDKSVVQLREELNDLVGLLMGVEGLQYKLH